MSTIRKIAEHMNQSKKISKLGVFCGASSGNFPYYKQSTEEFADAMSNAGISLVYGGSNVGLMGTIADRMLKNGSEVFGVIPESLIEVEIAHKHLTKQYIVHSMNERKMRIFELSDGFVMLPGGAGTLDEFFEMLTLAQLGYHQKPCGILNINHYYEHLLEFMHNVVSQGFMKQSYLDMIIVEAQPKILLEKLQSYEPCQDIRWKTEKVASQ